MRCSSFRTFINHSSRCQDGTVSSHNPPAFSPLSPLTDRRIQTTSVGANSVSAGPNRPSVDEMLTICCVHTLTLYSSDSLWCINDFSRLLGSLGFSLAVFTLELAALFSSGLEFPRSKNFQPKHVRGTESTGRENIFGLILRKIQAVIVFCF